MGSRSSKTQPTVVSTVNTSCQTDGVNPPANTTIQATQDSIPFKETHFVSSSKFPYKKPKLVERHMRQTQKQTAKVFRQPDGSSPEELDEEEALEGLDKFETCSCRKTHCSDTDTCLGKGHRVEHRYYSDLSMSRHTTARPLPLDLHPDAQPSPAGHPTGHPTVHPTDAMFHHPSSLTKGRCSPTPIRSPLYPIHDPT